MIWATAIKWPFSSMASLVLWRHLLSPALFLALFFLQGCSTTPTFPIDQLDPHASDCLNFFQELDQNVFEHDVEDSGDMRVQYFPFLRSNRFLASFRNEELSDKAYRQWLELLRQTDERARQYEYANLPKIARNKLSALLPVGLTFTQYLQDCDRLLVDETLAQDALTRSTLSALTAVPDSYRTWQRVIGLYPLASLFAQASLEDLHLELQRPFDLSLKQIPLSGNLVRYRPNASILLNKQTVADMFTAAYQNPLQLPLLEPLQLSKLFGHYAPLWEIDTQNDNDRIGMMTLKDGEPAIDTGTATVYVKHAYTRYRGDTFLQLIYQIWLPAREKTAWLDLYGGELDSLIWRVTLNRKGEPIAYDSVHACGCYYLLFPANGYRAATNDDEAEAVLSPKTVDYDPYRQKILLRLASRTHYLQQVEPINDTDSGTRYRLQNYENLRSLRSNNGNHENVFGSDGIIGISQRAERFLLWPYGIASPGAMRQWGSHAIAFTGRRHFDDAFLLEKLLISGEK